MRNGGTLTAIQFILLIAVGGGESVIVGEIRRDVADDVDELDPELSHAAAVLAQDGGAAVSQRRVLSLAAQCNVNNVDRGVFGSVPDVVREPVKYGRHLLLGPLEGGGHNHNAAAQRGLVGVRVKLKLEVHRVQTVSTHNVGGDYLVSPIHTFGVHVKRGVGDVAFFVDKERRKQIYGESGGLDEALQVTCLSSPPRTVESLPALQNALKLGKALVNGREPLLQEDVGADERQLSVVGAAEVGEAFDGRPEIVRNRRMVVCPPNGSPHHALRECGSLLEQAKHKLRALLDTGARDDNLQKRVKVAAVLARLLAHHRVHLLARKEPLDGEVTVNDAVEDGAGALPAPTANLRERGIAQPLKEVIDGLIDGKDVAIKEEVSGGDGLLERLRS
mmetsp:Transcript_29460/g.72939  ORF Transcript_29460/g.72939 Transcript_29460/m.72939 type:complete len:390 (+) Transcript_29460:2587-3756(+)